MSNKKGVTGDVVVTGGVGSPPARGDGKWWFQTGFNQGFWLSPGEDPERVIQEIYNKTRLKSKDLGLKDCPVTEEGLEEAIERGKSREEPLMDDENENQE